MDVRWCACIDDDLDLELLDQDMGPCVEDHPAKALSPRKGQLADLNIIVICRLEIPCDQNKFQYKFNTYYNKIR